MSVAFHCVTHHTGPWVLGFSGGIVYFHLGVKVGTKRDLPVRQRGSSHCWACLPAQSLPSEPSALAAPEVDEDEDGRASMAGAGAA